MQPARQVYCTYCDQTYFTSEVETCSLCGKVGGLVDPHGPEAIAKVVAKKQETAPFSQQKSEGILDAVDSALLTWRLLKLGAAGVFGIVIGIVLLVHPDLREDSRGLSARDFFIGIGPIIAGVVILGFLGWLWWRTNSRR